MSIMTKLDMISVRMYPDGRMDAKNAALYLGLEEKTLAMKRSDGTGPHFIKRGRIFYFKEDLDAWLNECKRAKSTAQLRSQEKIQQT
ncbi:MAG: helix-turn-helix domain-containing protein [Desulfobulbaceae bacterium]|nr:helix-turn-helix domain-containing protein [Desulfobulbaceae bacterium]